MIHIEIDIFSGMPNPTFYLSARAEQEFLHMLTQNTQQILSAGNTPGNLGFRGVFVSTVKIDELAFGKSQQKRIAEFASDFYIARSNNPFANDLLFWLMSQYRQSVSPVELTEGVVNSAVEAIKGDYQPIKQPFRQDLIVPYGAGMSCASTFLLDNRINYNQSDRLLFNNCYCFAANDPHSSVRNGRGATPGVKAGRGAINRSDITVATITDRLLADGWKHSCVPMRNLCVVCVIKEQDGKDFHFYRLTSTSPYIWCHKPGQTQAINTDNSGRRISDPTTCNRGGYKTLVGYFYQDNNTATVS